MDDVAAHLNAVVAADGAWLRVGRVGCACSSVRRRIDADAVAAQCMDAPAVVDMLICQAKGDAFASASVAALYQVWTCHQHEMLTSFQTLSLLKAKRQ